MKILNLSNICLIGALIPGLLMAQRGFLVQELSAKHLTAYVAGCYCSGDAMSKCARIAPDAPCAASRRACIMDPDGKGVCDACTLGAPSSCKPCFGILNCMNQSNELCYGY